MKEPTKEPITRKMIESEINKAAKMELAYIAYPVFAVVVLLAPLLWLSFRFFRDTPILFIPYVVVLSLCVLLCGYCIYKSIYKYRVLKRMNYSVVTDEVSMPSKDEMYERRRTADFICFLQYGKYMVERSVFELSSVGDVFYLVVIDLKKKKNILIAYPSKIYKYTEE